MVQQATRFELFYGLSALISPLSLLPNQELIAILVPMALIALTWLGTRKGQTWVVGILASFAAPGLFATSLHLVGAEPHLVSPVIPLTGYGLPLLTAGGVLGVACLHFYFTDD